MQLGRRYDPLYGKCSAASATTQSRSCIAGDVVSSSVWQMYIEMINGTFITQILCTERLTAEKQTVWRMRASLQTSTRSCRHTETCSQHCPERYPSNSLRYSSAPLLGYSPELKYCQSRERPPSAAGAQHCELHVQESELGACSPGSAGQGEVALEDVSCFDL